MKSYFKSPVRSIGFGIDFGTSNSAAAMFDGGEVEDEVDTEPQEEE